MLWKKMFRDLRENKLAYISSTIIIVIGIMVYTSFSMVMDNLTLSKDNFYTNQNFADGFAEVAAMPYSEVEKLTRIEGIKDIEGRIIRDVRVLSIESDENVYLRLVSIDPNKEKPINGVELNQGISLEDNVMNIWVDNKFFAANNLRINQEIAILAKGKKISLNVIGAGSSPEFIYALRTASDLYPSPETFGIAFIPYESMQTLFSDNATVNNLIFTLKPEVEYRSVEEKLKPVLEQYGLKSIYPRKDQTSHLMLTNELKGLQATAKALPLIFLSIAGMILYIMIRRIVEQQRGQIGILKAFGYTSKEIIIHYMSYAFIIGLAGGVIGGLAGIALSFPFTSMYQTFFNMPGLYSKFSVEYLIISVILSLLFSLFAGYQGCKGVLKLDPAEAMQPPAPIIGKKTLIEQFNLFWKMLTVQGKMAIRNISRNKGRSIFIFLGIMFTFSLSGLTWSLKNLTDQMIFDQYEKVEIYDVKIALAQPLNEKKVTWELEHFPGVKRVEPMAEIPVTLQNKWLKKDTVLIGLQKESNLYNILDSNGKQIALPENGIIISERLAELLNAEVGTKLTIDSTMMKDPDESKQIEVVGIIPQYVGINAYMEINEAQNLLDQGDLTTAIMLSIDKDKIPLLKEKYSETSIINGIDERAQQMEKIKELMASYSGTIFIFALLAVITGFAVVYSSSIITLSERSHELASMMVIGMTAKEVLSVITFEQWFIGFFGMIAGIPMSKLLLIGMAESVSNDVYTMPTTMTSLSIVTAIIITAFSMWIAQRMAAKKIKKLNLADVLKARE